jgi:DNA-binding GntR family transcriptional regulator
MLEGLAFRRAAETNAECVRKLAPSLIERGRKTVESDSVAEMIAADLAFHSLIHDLSRNPLIGSAMEAQWVYTQRVMGDVLRQDEAPHAIWAQHEEMLQAVIEGQGDRAERLAREHVTRAAAIVIARLSDAPAGGAAPWRRAAAPASAFGC